MIVSDFIDKHNDFLALTDEEHSRAKQSSPTNMHVSTQSTVNIMKVTGTACDQMIKQMEKTVEIAEVKYPKSDGLETCQGF